MLIGKMNNHIKLQRLEMLHFPVIVVLLVIFLSVTSCQREPKFSEIPYIEFVSLDKISNDLGYDDEATLVLYFQDGDGNLGLDASDNTDAFDTSSIYHYNLWIDYYEKQNGTFVLVELPITNDIRFPRLSNTVPESIEGRISTTMSINNYFSPYDTVMFTFQIVDRDLNMSNVVPSPEIIINK